jgi:D-3-phosphoglycerate dehydrogenase
MKPGAIIINTARGGLIDEKAAYEFLQSGHLGGLGIDVYEEEPPKQSPLFTLDNVVLTPHTASHTVEATAAMASRSVQNLIDVLSGRDCPYIVE